MPKIEPFEHYLNRYEQWFIDNRWAYLSEIEAIKRLLPEKGKGIEIGVGSGLFAKPLGIKLGVEPATKMANLARQRGITVVRAVAENLPLKNKCFDFVLMVTTVCFLDNVKKAFLEVHRILKPSGKFIIGFIDRQSPIGTLYEQFKDQNVFYRLATFYSVPQIIEILKQSYFTNFEFKQTIFKMLDKIKNLEPVEEGYGKGSFVVIQAEAQK